LHGIEYDPRTEIMVTPGGIKGSLSVAFHTLLNPGDEVVIPVPNWPHYGDMVRLHGATPKIVLLAKFPQDGLSGHQLEAAISERTALIMLGDCINPTGKVYTTQELTELAQVIAQHNVRREARGAQPIHVLFDCPYEAHVLGTRAKTFAAIEVVVDGQRYAMRGCTTWVTGPGKTYGMHGDRIGYLCAAPDILEMAARVQVNLTSFASTYGQVATHLAMQPEMDEVATARARSAREGLDEMLRQLGAIPSMQAHHPVGGYFLFIDFSPYAPHYKKHGYARVDQFLLEEARVATLCGSHFAEGEDLDHFVRINCGRSIDLIRKAGQRIQQSLARLVS
jgi:aspartate aminotransferase